MYGQVITKFSGMGRFTYPWCSAGALRAPELRYESLEKIDLSLVSFETGNLSADSFKKVLDLDGSTLESAVRSGDTGQRIYCFDSCQLITILMCN